MAGRASAGRGDQAAIWSNIHISGHYLSIDAKVFPGQYI